MMRRYSVILTLASSVGVLFPPPAAAEPPKRWSADLQATSTTTQLSYAGSKGDVWNVLGVAHYGEFTVNPSWRLKDNEGNDSPVVFSIDGKISSFNGGGHGQGANPIGCDYFLWIADERDPRNAAAVVRFKFTGLVPKARYELAIFGASQYSNRDFLMWVDTNGNGRLDDEKWVGVVNENETDVPRGDTLDARTNDEDRPAATPLISPSLRFGRRPAHVPPHVVFSVVAGASGAIVGKGQAVQEANWSGFQLSLAGPPT